jgi:transposase
MNRSEISTQRLDHLGIVAGICQQIDLIGQIDQLVGPTGRKVSVGQAIQAMVLNGLGFVNRPLYLTPEFYANKPVEVLIGAGMSAEDLNDDCLGRALDAVYSVGVTQVFAQAASHALWVMGIVPRFAHVDTSAFSVEGAYVGQDDGGAGVPIKITYGYSKDHRLDLKPVMLALICANASSLPIYLATLDGNRSGKKALPDIAQAYLKQFEESEEKPYIIADSALFSEDNSQALAGVTWITRVPATLTQAQQVLADIVQGQMRDAGEGYFFLEQTVTYGNIEQRWLLVLYEPKRERDVKQLEKAIEREHDQACKALKQLGREVFSCEADAHLALARLSATWKYHQVESQIQPVSRHERRGRPRADAQPITVWRVQGKLKLDDERLTALRAPLGKYIVATNELDQSRLPTTKLLETYKDQKRSVERGFRFLKDPLFFAASFFLKKPSRIMGLLMVMGLSLLVYALAEHVVRTQLAAHDETIPDQLGKPTKSPTMRRIFQMFDGIDLLIVQNGTMRLPPILNLKPVHQQLLTLLGETVRHFYLPITYGQAGVT